MNTSLYIAARYLFSRKKRNAINIISGIAVLAFTVCTAALIIILSTMNGFEGLIFSMYNKFNPDIRISPAQGKVFEERLVNPKLRNISNILLIQPVLEDNAAIKNGDYQSVCTVKGVDSNYLEQTGLDIMVSEGEPLISEGKYNYAVLGSGVRSKINSSVSGPFSVLSLIAPRRGNFNMSDADAISTFEIQPSAVLTMDETISNRYVYVPIGFARELFERPGKVSSLEIRLKRVSETEATIHSIKKILGKDFKVNDRYEQQASLYKMFRSEKWASYAILSFILLIAAFNALGSLTMLVMDKKQDIITLSGIGLSDRKIRKVFLYAGLLIAGIGALSGLVIGTGLVFAQEIFGLVKMHGAIIENYPVELRTGDVILVLLTGIGLGLMASVYPAMKAGRLLK